MVDLHRSPGFVVGGSYIGLELTEAFRARGLQTTVVLPALAAAGLRTSDALAIEKPFGNDLASARELNETPSSRASWTTT